VIFFFKYLFFTISYFGRLHISQFPKTLLLINVQWAHVHDSPLAALSMRFDELPLPPIASAKELAAPVAAGAKLAKADSLELNESDLESK
jgi:hypothetical protein